MTDIENYRNGIRSKGALTCPQCGAPIVKEKCSYCGALFYDFACIDTKEPFFLKIKHDEEIHIIKVLMDSTQVEITNDPVTFYSNNDLYMTMSSQEAAITMKFHKVE